MCLKGIRVGFALTGSHCCLEAVIPQLRNLINEGADIFPIISQAIDTTDTRYGSSDKWKKQLKDITGRDAMTTMVETEPMLKLILKGKLLGFGFKACPQCP
jgi:dipicolinate synthase subunit B